jgi:hypothetical protein
MSTIALALGHPEETPDPTLGPNAQSIAEGILAQLTDLDSQIADTRRDGMALEIDGMKVDFFNHRTLLLQEGSRLLRELAMVTGLPLVYDRYTGRAVTATNPNSTFVVLG